MKIVTPNHALQLIQKNISPFLGNLFPKSQNKIFKKRIITLTSCNTEGYLLAEDCKAPLGYPAYNNSAMDGYVFHRTETFNLKLHFPVQFDITPEMKKIPVLKKGFCARITTGGGVPEGDVIIVPVENILQTPQGIRIVSIPSKNFIRFKNEGYKKGEIILKKGTLIRSYELGILISAGIRKVKVFDKIRINIINTGNELNNDNNTNGPVIYSILKTIPWVEVNLQKPVKDSLSAMKKRFIQALPDSDVLITTGGVSMGKYDFVYNCFTLLGVDFFINKISQKPGKPLRIGKWKLTLVCALPGNPVSAVFCTDLYVKYILSLLSGTTVKIASAISETEVTNKSSLDMFCLGETFQEGTQLKVRSEKEIQSHLFHKYFNRNCYVKIPSNTIVKHGDVVRVIKF